MPSKKNWRRGNYVKFSLRKLGGASHRSEGPLKLTVTCILFLVFICTYAVKE